MLRLDMCLKTLTNAGVGEVLRNDYKEITAAIERNLITLHSGGFSKESTVSERHAGLQS